MNIIIVGAGRAGGSLALALEGSSHRVVGVLSRSRSSFGPQLDWDDRLPSADLIVLAVPDAVIAPMAERLAPAVGDVDAAVHVSGFSSIDLLEPLADQGLAVGALHPLQTLPDPVSGAEALAGSWAGVTASSPLREALFALAHDLEMRPFALADSDKAAYHAAASSAATFVTTALGLTEDLLASTSVPLKTMRPLVERVVANAFELGPTAAMTGPIVRGDVATVAGQQRVADAIGDTVGTRFGLLAEAARHQVQ